MNIRTDPVRLTETTATDGESPIRSNLSRAHDLERLGAALARGADAVDPPIEIDDLTARLTENAQCITAVVRATDEARRREEQITPAATWLLENHYLVEETVRHVRRDLPRRFYRQLPKLALPDGREVPRPLVIAWVYVSQTDSAVSQESFQAIVDGFQSVSPLSIGELWALPSFLRYALLENLRRLALRVLRARRMRRKANEAADAILPAQEGEDLRELERYSAHARDITFATQLLFRLRDGSQNAGRALAWLETELERAGSDAEETTLREHARLSSGNVTTGNIILGLRRINDIDWTQWFERVSKVDELLREQSDLASLDFSSRDLYRREIERLAKRSGKGECEIARKAIEISSGHLAASAPVDAGLALVGPLRPRLEAEIGYVPPPTQRLQRFYRATGWAGLVLPVLAVTFVFMLVSGIVFDGLGLSSAAIMLLLVLFALPASEAALGIYNIAVTLALEPTRLVGYEFKHGIPADARTLVVVPTLIGSRDDVEDAIDNLEVHHLANRGGDIHFALLSDWPDSRVEQTQADMELLQFARERIAELNQRHPKDGHPFFYLLHRRRLYCDSESRWMGWERKRGKLHELNALLRGDGDTTFLPSAEPLPPDMRYVMTVDADTRTTRDAVRRLVGKMHHPLNRPVLDPVRRIVREGYGILQPRVTPSLTTGDEASFFQRVFSVHRGMDPYVFAVSDVYQDAFGSGTFTGKGLYDIDAMEAALTGRIPENAVLSHDLLEGAYANAGLVTDVELVEDYPTRYRVDAARNHRWARGDWQLLPYILDPRSSVPGLSRWKMIDNLRRTLVPVFWILASVAGWTLLPAFQAAIWQALLVLCLFFPPTFDIVRSLLQRQPQTSLRGHVNAFVRDFFSATAQVVLRIALIAHTAWSMCDAIIRTLYRMFVSRRHLLEWRTASQVARSADGGIEAHYRAMSGAVAIAAAGLVIPLAAGSGGAVVALFFCLLWAVSPTLAWFVSRPERSEERLRISPEEAMALRTAARRSWHYFETFVTAEHNMLPPDNFQELPEPAVAARTSPTNIGIYLLSVVAARDFGWISLSAAVDRLDRTLTTIEGMQRHRGHLFNWYDTKSLQPLLPRYVSSVDSGNLAGHLIAIAGACRHWSEVPAVHVQGDISGVLDVAVILDETLQELPDDRRSLRPLRQRLRDRLTGMRKAIVTIRDEPETASIRVINLVVIAAEIRKLATDLDLETGSDRSRQVAEWAAKLEVVSRAHVDDAHSEETSVVALRGRLVELARRARTFAMEMDFSFLLREDRKLLSIGYRVEEGQLDEACYDLLASEARLTSLLAIAKGDLPTEHWFRLGRPATEIAFRGTLISWSGSMFEYLMPPLVMKEPLGGILNQSNMLIIKRQISYARSKGIPWGISESAYNARDREMTYQYTNFGVPGLGLKRGLSENLVVAPYATLLAAQFRPAAAVENLKRLAEIGALGAYGYHDAIDFTPERLPAGARHVVVANFMAHHTGMSIVAVANAVFEGVMRDRFHADPVIEAAELLLQEKAPRRIPVTALHKEEPGHALRATLEENPDLRVVTDPAGALVATSLLSNGHYHLMLTAAGNGYSRYRDVALTRWPADPSEDRSGSFLFLTDRQTGEWWSSTASPRTAPGETTRTVFADDKASFFKSVRTLHSEVECIVASECEGEARRITIVNSGTTERLIDVTSFAEIALATEAADAAHPAFSKMFVRTAISPDRRCIIARRQVRSAGEPAFALAHFVTAAHGIIRGAEAETDRRRFIGRGRSIADPAAFDHDVALSCSDGFTLDPVAALRCSIRIAPGKKVGLTFWTVVADSEAEAEVLVERLSHHEAFDREAMLAWTRSQVQTRHCGMSLAEAAGVQRLARYLIYPHAALRAQADTIAAGLGRQSALWPTAISGDFPIFALRIADVADLETVAHALRMQEYMRARGLVADFVVVNEQAASYVQDLQHGIELLCENSRLRGKEQGPRQHIFAVRRDLMDHETYRTLIAAARVVLHARNGRIIDQIVRAEAHLLEERASTPALPPKPPAKTRDRPAGEAQGSDLAFWNGFGGFDRDCHDYVVRLTGDDVTPHPWINVVANRDFGFHVSAEGAGFTWSRNSRDFQLTPWSNDPVGNRPGEAIYIHDRDSGEAFAPVACVLRDAAVTYEARHAAGVSRFSAERGDLSMELTQLVDPDDPVKISALSLRNRGKAPLRLRIYACAEWVLGSNRARTAPTVVPAHDAASSLLMARNPYSLDHSDRTAFMASSGADTGVTCSRAEFIGSGDITAPGAVVAGLPLSGRVEAGDDPCAAMACDVEIAAGGTAELRFLLGDASSEAEARELAARHLNIPLAERLAANDEHWNGFFATLSVKTPDAAFDHVVNRWLPYQALACRIRARAAFYQASGAYGFRDQLQDTLSLLLHDPDLAREQILNAASRQFVEGDVQHWWLPRGGAGVRTRISDDVVWLGYAAHRYIEVTGDEAILDVEIPFIEGPALKEGEHDAFFEPERTGEAASLLEHCARALDLAIERTGAGGLPLILGGDWNDGMNRVGEEGRGESVWLGWFLLKTLRDLIPVAEARGLAARVKKWRRHADRLKKALEEAGWDGAWYRRGSFDDGTPLGSKEAEECRIDSIAQSWAVLSGAGDPERCATAIDNALEMLTDREAGIFKLFTPPFETSPKDPGYIKSYPPGVRENGGQYTHAATWMVLALAQMGRNDDAYRLFSMLNPVNHALDREAAERYRVEPYVVAADVYAGPGRDGRGGWTWYTGSAGWLYRAAVEGILGVDKRGERLHLKPNLPGDWPGFEMRMRFGDANYDIEVRRGSAPGVTVDGRPQQDGIELDRCGSHRVVVTVA